MKAIFPLLLCYVLMTAQTYALSGGPVFRSVNSYIGYYSGTLRATTDLLNPNSKKPKLLAPNSVGVFTFSVDATASTNSIQTTTGTASQVTTGTFLLFMNGQIFDGTISAVVNPVSGGLTGIIAASDDVVSATTGASSTLRATGYMNAKIDATSTNATSTALRVNGKATLQIDFGIFATANLQPVAPTQTVMFNVSGFQQTSIPTTSVSSTGNAGTTTGTGTGGTTGGTGGIGTGL